LKRRREKDDDHLRPLPARHLRDSGVTDYRLTVYVEKIPSTASVVYAVFIEPPLHGNMRFCGTACLIAWTDTIRPKERAT
jgi:hypothetical protein